ncbi:MDR family MFS transporter [Georgenia alba]|uniref:MDR family MFS transporter n=1 Tax=Georgenia alba TaxID=2233858 RepID=A0ABW2Q8T9_9MICO
MRSRPKDLTQRRAYAGMTPEQAEVAHAEHRQILKVLPGLLLAMFVSTLSMMIVGNALPVIVGEIGGTQQQYTWIVTASILASTVATPIVGKLADLFDKKRLLLGSIAVFAVGSLLAGMSVSAGMLIAVRVLQGLGMGAIMVLVQITIASIIPPRQRGRYNGYLGSVMATSTVAGPLVGGIIVDVEWLGWRWCFWAMLPFMAVALVVLWKNLQVPTVRRPGVRVDWAGAVLVSLAATLLLLWISFADHSFAWLSWQTAALLSGAVLASVAFVLVERRTPEPVVPLHILTERNTALAIVASLAVGTVMFGNNIFLGQYFQIGRGFTPTASGWMILPLMLGLLVSSTVSGNLVSRSGRWKPHVLGGVTLLAVGVGLLVSIRATTPLPLIAGFLLIAGLGLGASMQNLVLAVQNSNSLANVGAATSTVTFFRTLGGAVGIQLLGAIYAHRVTSLTVEELGARGIDPGQMDAQSSSLDLSVLPPPVVEAIRDAYGNGVSTVFLIAAGIAVLGVIAVLLMRSTMLRSTWDVPEPARQALEDDAGPGTAAAPGDLTPAATAMVDRSAVPRADGAEPAPEHGAPRSSRHASQASAGRKSSE